MGRKLRQRNTCRISGEPLVELFSLGELYVSDFIAPKKEPRLGKAELRMCLAPTSGLVQLAHSVPLDDMYREYWYRSGTNKTMMKELRDIAEKAQRYAHTKPGDIFVDIGCNDGTLLRFADQQLVRVGFEPAQNDYAASAQQYAHMVINDYFNAKAYRASHYGDRKAKVVTSIAMFYDLENPHTFVRDVRNILDDNGLWIIQMSYLPLMLEQLAFDNICHEHLKYYSLSSLKYLLDQHKFKIVDCELNDVNGGSFRIYIQKEEAAEASFASAPHRDVASFRVASILAYEKKLRLNQASTYRTFFKTIDKLRQQTVNFIKKEKELGKQIWGYGASTKGNTLLQWYGLDHTLIEAVAERSPAKYGLKTVGTDIPIASEKDMRKAKPDYLLVLPWHFINEFREREQGFLKRGGKFIVPCPHFEIIGWENNRT